MIARFISISSKNAAFISSTGAEIAINIIGASDINPDWSNPVNALSNVFITILEGVYNAENIKGTMLEDEEMGLTILRADFMIQGYEGIGFLIFDGSQFTIVNAVLANESMRDDFYSFVSEIEFI